MKDLIINFLRFFVRIFRCGSPFYLEKNATISSKAAICSGVKFYRSTIDAFSYIGKNSIVESAVIGKFTSISSNCYIGGAAHPIDWVSTSPVFCSGGNILKTNFSDHQFNPYKNTYIGNDVWIGHSAVIKAGVTIANGAIIGTGSVVTKNVGPYEIWAGNPARLIRKRFDDNTVDKLLSASWWDLPIDKLKDLAKYSNNVNHFIEKVEDL